MSLISHFQDTIRTLDPPHLYDISITISNTLTPESCRYGQAGMEQNDSTVSKGDIAITVDVNMPEDSPLQELRSPSHPIAVTLGRTSTSESEPPQLSRASATLCLGTSSLDQDFVLEITYQVRYFGVTLSYLFETPIWAVRYVV